MVELILSLISARAISITLIIFLLCVLLATTKYLSLDPSISSI